MTTAPTAPKVQQNDPNQAGTLASKKHLHGEGSRYATYAVHTRFDAVQWFTADAYQMDEKTQLPAIIRQSATFDEAIAGL